MRFHSRKKRQPPAIIIVALIDILIVLVIFLMVTTTFKQQPAVKLALPETSHATKMGAHENPPLVVSIDSHGDLRMGKDAIPVTLERLKQELISNVSTNPDLRLAIAPDTNAPCGPLFKIRDIAAEVNLKPDNLSALVRETGKP